MKGPRLGPGGKDITWPNQVASWGRKASSTRKHKPETTNRNLGGDLVQPRWRSSEITLPSPAGRRRGARILHGHSHRSMAVCHRSPGLPMAQPSPSLVIVPSPPLTHTHRVLLYMCVM